MVWIWDTVTRDQAHGRQERQQMAWKPLSSPLLLPQSDHTDGKHAKIFQSLKAWVKSYYISTIQKASIFGLFNHRGFPVAEDSPHLLHMVTSNQGGIQHPQSRMLSLCSYSQDNKKHDYKVLSLDYFYFTLVQGSLSPSDGEIIRLPISYIMLMSTTSSFPPLFKMCSFFCIYEICPGCCCTVLQGLTIYQGRFASHKPDTWSLAEQGDSVL